MRLWGLPQAAGAVWADMAAETALCAAWRLPRGAAVLESPMKLAALLGAPGLGVEAVTAVFHEDDRAVLASLWALPAGEDVTVTARLGAGRVMRLRAQGQRGEVVGLMVDVTAQTRAEAQAEAARAALNTVAREDELTGLASRRQFETILATEFKRALRSGQALGLVLADIDHFRAYNQRYGRGAGDVMLRQVAGALKAQPRRAGDVLARYDSAVFALLLPLAREAGTVYVAGLLVQAVRRLRLPHVAGEGGIVTLSCGATAFTGLAETGNPVELLRRAEQALGRAKQTGRNTVQRYQPGLAVPAA
jgi:diguanylate cyclase (GGDEF)-like protein